MIGRRRVAATLATVALFALAGCTSDPNSVAEQAKAGDRKGYVSGDGTIERIAPADRKEPVDLAGKTVTDADWSSSSVRGKVVVINVWGSWCPPCVAEADELQRTWVAYDKAKAPVAFMGIDFREAPDSGQAFLTNRKITYPSLSDTSGLLILALQGKAASVPTTLVLDRKGRIAARVSGSTTQATLTGLVDDVVAEPAG